MRQYLIDVREERNSIAVISTFNEKFVEKLQEWATKHGYALKIRTSDKPSEETIGFQHK